MTAKHPASALILAALLCRAPFPGPISAWVSALGRSSTMQPRNRPRTSITVAPSCLAKLISSLSDSRATSVLTKVAKELISEENAGFLRLLVVGELLVDGAHDLVVLVEHVGDALLDRRFVDGRADDDRRCGGIIERNRQSGDEVRDLIRR